MKAGSEIAQIEVVLRLVDAHSSLTDAVPLPPLRDRDRHRHREAERRYTTKGTVEGKKTPMG